MNYHPRYGRNQLGQSAQEAMPAQPNIIARDFFTYNFQYTDLLAQTSATGFIQIEADSDFLVRKMTYFSTVSGAAVTFNTNDVPQVSLVIIDTGSGRQLMNNPVPISDIFGDGRMPFILPTPKLFVKNSRISLQAFNFGTDDYDDLWVNFIGEKIFSQG